MKYFAYGSNMSLARLRERVPSAERLGSYCLRHHRLRFHKTGKDGSGKCNALFTHHPGDYLFGALFEICPLEKKNLDEVEGLGYGYDEKIIVVSDDGGAEISASTYYATRIDDSLKPYCWYKNHVLVGAQESSLPAGYIREIQSIQSMPDYDPARAARQYAIHGTRGTIG